MGLIDRAKKDWKQITTNKDSGFGVDINISTPDGSTSVDIVGLFTKHHIGFDTSGLVVNTRNVHMSFSEEQLTDAGYPVRNSNYDVSMLHHVVTVKDSTGRNNRFAIRETFPDETIGVILCIMYDYKDDESGFNEDFNVDYE